MTVQLEAARALLAVREPSGEREIRRAFRRRVRELRPDLPGRVDGQVVVDLREARQVLMSAAGHDRHLYVTCAASGADRGRPFLPETWGLVDDPPPRLRRQDLSRRLGRGR